MHRPQLTAGFQEFGVKKQVVTPPTHKNDKTALINVLKDKKDLLPEDIRTLFWASVNELGIKKHELDDKGNHCLLI